MGVSLETNHIAVYHAVTHYRSLNRIDEYEVLSADFEEMFNCKINSIQWRGVTMNAYLVFNSKIDLTVFLLRWE